MTICQKRAKNDSMKYHISLVASYSFDSIFFSFSDLLQFFFFLPVVISRSPVTTNYFLFY